MSVVTDITLSVDDLKTYFFMKGGKVIPTLDGVSFEVGSHNITALVGESGSGKTLTACSIIRLVRYPARIVAGRVLFKGQDLLRLSQDQMRRHIRGKRISITFQSARNSLNPLVKVGKQIGDIMSTHQKLAGKQVKQRTLEILESVSMPEPRSVMNRYPHELSGGMCMRIAMGVALACDPDLLIADEPTTGLDVTTQRYVLDTVKSLTRQKDMSVLIITHDLGVVAQTCDTVAVMHAGHVVEFGDVETVFSRPAHPYTRGLLGSVLRLDKVQYMDEVKTMRGDLPDVSNLRGCRFVMRCPCTIHQCNVDRPPYSRVGLNHRVMCFNSFG